MGSLHTDDLRGLIRLAGSATVGVAEIVETVHADILCAPRFGRGPGPRRAPFGIGWIYEAVRVVARLAAAGGDAALAALPPGPARDAPTPRRDALVAALNGVFGDHLCTADNPLATPMTFRHRGAVLPLDRAALARVFPDAPHRIVVLVHGLCRHERQWDRRGHDHGSALARDLGVAPVYVRYNTGRSVAANGRELSTMLEALVAAWPSRVEELALVGHSMGGLVIRSACHHGGADDLFWPSRLASAVFLGTPHHGAVLERLGHTVDEALAALPYAAALARVGLARSAGITDLRFAVPARFAHGPTVVDRNPDEPGDVGREDEGRGDERRDERPPADLPPGVSCHAIAASLGRRRGDLRDRLLGDGLVHLDSALGEHADPALALSFPEGHRFVAWNSSHLDLLGSDEVYREIRARVSAGGVRG